MTILFQVLCFKNSNTPLIIFSHNIILANYKVQNHIQKCALFLHKSYTLWVNIDPTPVLKGVRVCLVDLHSGNKLVSSEPCCFILLPQSFLSPSFQFSDGSLFRYEAQSFFGFTLQSLRYDTLNKVSTLAWEVCW